MTVADDEVDRRTDGQVLDLSLEVSQHVRVLRGEIHGDNEGEEDKMNNGSKKDHIKGALQR